MITILDLDNCIVDDEWRIHWLRDGNYDAYHRAACLDPPPTSDVVLPESKIVIITGRPDLYHKATINYMLRYGLGDAKLFMRPRGDSRPSPAFKASVVMQHFNITDIVAAYDDREDIVAAYRSIGLPAEVLAINKR